MRWSVQALEKDVLTRGRTALQKTVERINDSFRKCLARLGAPVDDCPTISSWEVA